MNILLIAPTASDLVYQTAELKSILQSDNTVMPLLGKSATVSGLISLLNQQYEIIWFAGHSDDTGVLLSDGKLPLAELAPLVRNSRLLILNSCESIGMASGIMRATSLDLISHIGEVEDKNAYRFGATLIQNLERYRGNYKKAFDESVSAGETDYVFLRSSSSSSSRWVGMVDDLTKAMFELKTEIALLTQRITTVERALEVALKQMPERTPSEDVLRVIVIVLILIAILIGVGIYVLAG